MTSEERHEARYQRRKAKRGEARAKRQASFGDVVSFGSLYESYRRRRRGVGWKATVQSYRCQAPINVIETHKRLVDGTYRQRRTREFDVMERGKTRRISAVGIADRVVQGALCDGCLTPAIVPTLINDNGACVRGKGYHFSQRRLARHLREFHRSHGRDGYVLLFDFHGYFESVSHGLAKSVVSRHVEDERLVSLAHSVIDGFRRGLGLGSPLSQMLALAMASPIDHHCKDVLGLRWYGRYMDDGYVIHHDKARLMDALRDIRSIAESLGLELNGRKVTIVRLTHEFTYCKARFRLTESGRVVRRMPKGASGRERRKLRGLKRKMDDGVLAIGDVWQSYQSWRAYAQTFDSHATLRSMDGYFQTLFPEWGGR